MELCFACLREPPPALRRCAGCHAVFFCDAACQKAGWGRHRDECKRRPAQAAADRPAADRAAAIGTAPPVPLPAAATPEADKLDNTEAAPDMDGGDGETASLLPVSALLGAAMSSARVRAFLGAPGDFAAAERKAFKDGAVFYTFKERGISLCFEKDALSAVHGFPPAFQLPAGHVLPSRFDPAWTNAETVQRLGEPALKGGGGFAGDAVWISFPELGLQVEFAGCSWEHRNLPVANFVVFAPSSESDKTAIDPPNTLTAL